MASHGRGSVFYKPAGDVKEIRSGYLFKSPPENQMWAEKSWKRRYFVLFKIGKEEHQLLYFKNPDERPVGEIDLTQLSLLSVGPETHQKWSLIQRSFKCSPSCVLYFHSAARDYFLVGESSQEVDAWFSDLFEVLKNRPHEILSSVEVADTQDKNEQVISKPLLQKKTLTSLLEKPLLKYRSISDPLSQTMSNHCENSEFQDKAKRRASQPEDCEIYDYPRSYLQWKIQAWTTDDVQDYNTESHTNEAQLTDAAQDKNTESLYESMSDLERNEEQIQEPKEVPGSLMRTVTKAFDEIRTCMFDGEIQAHDREGGCPSSDFSSISSDIDIPSPVNMLDGQNGHILEKLSSTESLDRNTLKERDIEVKQADLKKHLTVTEVDGKPSVSGWTGLPQNMCLFHKGDQILAINDLHIRTVKEFKMFLSKSLKTEVKVTILRQPVSQPLHLPNCLCSD